MKRNARLFWMFFKRNVLGHYSYIEWFLPFDILNLIVGIASWYFYGLTFGGRSPLLEPYGGDFVAFLILGVAFNTLFSFALTSVYAVVVNMYQAQISYGGVRVTMADYLALAKIPWSVYAASYLFWEGLMNVITFVAYFFAGLYLFGMSINPNANYLGGFIALILGFVSMLGISMFSASMVWLMGAWHGVEPINWIVTLLAGLVSGVYFPPDVLPDVLRIASNYLPQTYTLKAIRLALLGGYGNTQLLPYFSILTVYVIVLIPSGAFLLKYSFKVARRKATLM